MSSISDELSIDELHHLYRLLCIDLPDQKTDWVTISSPLREDKNPSFRLNVETSSWMDHGTGAKGDIVNLVEQLTGKDKVEAIHWIREQIGSATPKPIERKAPAKKKSPSPFWTPERFRLFKQANQRLLNEPDHALVSMIQERDKIPYRQLIKYRCGIIFIWNKERLLFPYQTGAQLYRREKGKHEIRHLKDDLGSSKPKLSFFGVKQSQQECQQGKTLNITKSPREAMLLDHWLNGSEMVIGLATGEKTVDISSGQEKQLKKLIKHGTRSIRIFMDTVTDEEKRKVFSFAKNIDQVLNRSGQPTIRISIH